MCCAASMSPSASGRISVPGSVAATSIAGSLTAIGHRRGPAAGDQVSLEDAIEVAHHRTANLGVVVVVRRRVHSPVDATNDRNPGIDHEQLDVVDHLLAHRIVDDIDPAVRSRAAVATLASSEGSSMTVTATPRSRAAIKAVASPR